MRGVQATAAGDAFVRHARTILGQVEQMRGELRSFATGLKGRIRMMSNTAALAAFRAISLQNAIPMARVRQNDFYTIGRVLDRGALGIVVPMVNSVANAQAAARAVHGIVLIGLEEKLQSIPLTVLREQVTTMIEAVARGLATQGTK